jgi:hypothetical protein
MKSRFDQVKATMTYSMKSRFDQVKATMTYSMKSENKLDGASNFRAWKTRIDLILTKNKMLDIVRKDRGTRV